jgi:acylglycerol lipase
VTEQTWTTGIVQAADGYALGYRKYQSAKPRGPVVACIHGIQSHAGWYDRSCRYLADAGFTTYFFDRRGSGMNTADRGHASSHWALLDDFHRCLTMLRQTHSESPIVVKGISWGGKVAVATLADHPDAADGLMLIAPGLAPKVRPPLLDQVRIAVSTFLNPRRKLPIPLSDPTLFTANPEWQGFIANDPRSIRQASARLLFCSRMLDIRLRRFAVNIVHPTLLVLATDDRIIDNAGTRKFVERFSSSDVEVVEVQASHTLEFEPDPTAFFATMRRWIERRFLGGAE